MLTAPAGIAPVPDSLLTCGLCGDSASARKFYNRIESRLRKRAASLGRDLPADLQEEVFQETWALVYARGVEARRAANIDDETYILMVARNAAEIVRANNRAPGTRSRAGASRHQIPAPLEYADLSSVPREKFLVAERAMNAYLDVASISARFGARERTAVQLMIDNGLSLRQTAETVGLSRQTLRRRLAALEHAA